MTEVEIECPKCHALYEPEPERSLIVVYDDRDYNHLRTYCPICEHGLVLFFDNPDFLTLGYTTVKLDEPQDDIQEVYDRIMFGARSNQGRPEPEGEEPDQDTVEFEPIQAAELTPRQEAEIAALGSFLDGADQIDLVDLVFASPPPKSARPQRWR
jgi:hypothetical protein